MSVAPSFVNFTRLCEPYTKGGRMYIKVQNPNTGTIREVRWYEEKFDGFKGLKKARGFEKGPILVIRNLRTPADEEWCKESVPRFAVGIGWYIVSTDTFPEDAPAHFKYLLLGWDEFRDKDDFHMKTPEQLAAILEAKARRKEFINIK